MNHGAQVLHNIKDAYQPKFKLQIVADLQELQRVSLLIQQTKICAVTVQGTSLDPMTSSCAGISIAYDLETVYFIPRHDNQDKHSLSLPQVIAQLQPIFANEQITKIAYHAAFDQIVLHHNDMPVNSSIFALDLAIQLCDDADQTLEKEIHNLYMVYALQSHQEQLEEHSDATAIESCLWNNIASVHFSLFLYPILQKQLAEKNLLDDFEKIYTPIEQMLIIMQMNGIYCDRQKLDSIDQKIHSELEQLQLIIDSYSPMPIDINVTQQLRHFLFETLDLPGKKKFLHQGPDETPATDDNILQELFDLHPAILFIVKYRKLKLFQMTVIKACRNLINSQTHNVHPSWQLQFGKLVTLQSQQPNLQEMVQNQEFERYSITNIFTAAPEKLLVACHLSHENSILNIALTITHEFKTEHLQVQIIAIIDQVIILQAHPSDEQKIGLVCKKIIAHKNFALRTGTTWHQILHEQTKVAPIFAA